MRMKKGVLVMNPEAKRLMEKRIRQHKIYGLMRPLLTIIAFVLILGVIIKVLTYLL